MERVADEAGEMAHEIFPHRIICSVQEAFDQRVRGKPPLLQPLSNELVQVVALLIRSRQIRVRQTVCDALRQGRR